MKLTHCDLFFADAAVLVEGTVEKLLLAQMIGACAQGLSNRYITVLEVGGAYAHKFSSLMEFLGIPYLVITDIDTVDAADARKACPADRPNAHTSNATLKSLLGKNTRKDLIALTKSDQTIEDGRCFVTFQRPVVVDVEGQAHDMHGRTLEEAFVYENLPLYQGGELSLGIDFAQIKTAEDIRGKVYAEIRDDGFKKTEFALGIASSSVTWRTPAYIEDGLKWLEAKLAPPAVSTPQSPLVKDAA